MILLSLLIGLTAVYGPMTAGAESAGRTETNEETGYSLLIEDTAGLLDAEETAEVTEAMRPILQYASAGFLTWPEDGGDRTAGATKAQRWGDRVFGPSTRFTVFIIDMETRHLAMSTGTRPGENTANARRKPSARLRRCCGARKSPRR